MKSSEPKQIVHQIVTDAWMPGWLQAGALLAFSALVGVVASVVR